jgi:hypothetical protein
MSTAATTLPAAPTKAIRAFVAGVALAAALAVGINVTSAHSASPRPTTSTPGVNTHLPSAADYPCPVLRGAC